MARPVTLFTGQSADVPIADARSTDSAHSYPAVRAAAQRSER